MNALVKEWISKAEGDYRLALLGLRAKEPSVYDGVCFHCQQCIEKYLKALLVRDFIHFEKRHDLIYCLNLLVPTNPTLEFLRDELRILNDYAVDLRYPGDRADYKEAKEAVSIMKLVRSILRKELGAKKTKK